MASTLRYSALHVHHVVRITPRMVRVTFGGEDLADFASAGPGQHVELFFSRCAGRAPIIPPMPPDGDAGRWRRDYLAMPEAERPWMRSCTVRRHDPRRQEIDVDFVLHGEDAGGGPASRWAAGAAVGDVVGMLGPQPGRHRPQGPRDWTLLVGDETALPAIGALIEALAPGERAVAYIEVENAAEEQEFATEGDVDVHWLHRDGVPPGRSALLADAVRNAVFQDGEASVWAGGESGTVRALRRHLVADRGVDRRSVALTVHWRLGLSQDDAPTDEDVADVADPADSSEAAEASAAVPAGG